METYAANTAGSDSRLDPSSAELTVTNPQNNVIQAYEGQPLTFYVKSNKDSAEYLIDGLEPTVLENASFENDKFCWMPPTEAAGHIYRIIFTAALGSGADAAATAKTVDISGISMDIGVQAGYRLRSS